MDTKSEKIALFRYGLVAIFNHRGPSPRRALPARTGDCFPPVRHSLLQTQFGLCRHTFAMGGTVSSGRVRGPGASSTTRPGQIPCHYSADCGLDRTPQTRKPLPHRYHTAPRTCSIFRTERSRGVLFYAVPIPQATRPDRVPTPRSPSV